MSGPSELLPFPSTCWSRIRVGSAEGDERRALETLAQAYARPIVAYLRRALARSGDDAADLAQDFFVWAIETGFLGKADPARGRFRAFLKVALRHYVADQDRQERAQKRGGGARFASLDAGEEELLLTSPDPTPEEALDAAWRAALVEGALERARLELERRGKGLAYAIFRDYFLDRSSGTDYRALAARHGTTPAGVSNHLTSAKLVYRAELRALALETVRSSADLDLELAWLVNEPPRGP
jgi:RNA polymerase sigma-70 factor (ECF subfamily)